MKVFQEFKEFALKGSVIDLAVGLIIGAAFGAVVNSLVKDVLMPPLGFLIGKVDFSALSLKLGGEPPVEIKYGSFLNAVIGFIIQAAAIFLVIKAINVARRRKEREVAKAPASPELTTQEKLLSEIRDLLKTGTGPAR
jgi:large conductance mechanosensitive channel